MIPSADSIFAESISFAASLDFGSDSLMPSGLAMPDTMKSRLYSCVLVNLLGHYLLDLRLLGEGVA